MSWEDRLTQWRLVSPAAWQRPAGTTAASSNGWHPLSVEELAARHGMSGRTLRRWFRTELDSSPAEEVRKARIELAKQLLLCTNFSVTDIAARCGFRSQRQFNDPFRRFEGTMLRNFREQGSGPSAG